MHSREVAADSKPIVSPTATEQAQPRNDATTFSLRDQLLPIAGDGQGGAAAQHRAAALNHVATTRPSRLGPAVRRLQRRYGNAYVNQVLAFGRLPDSSRLSGRSDLMFTRGGEEEEETSRPDDPASSVQRDDGPQFTVGSPDDVYEQEAHAVAEQVVWNLSVAGTAASLSAREDQAQHRDPEDEGTRTPEVASRAAVARAPRRSDNASSLRVSRSGSVGSAESTIRGSLGVRIQRSKGLGSALPTSVQHTMETQLGHDFSAVRVKTDPEATDLCDELGAQAFTNGSDIWLGQGKSVHDAGLMAHELTHVVQQGAAAPLSAERLLDRVTSDAAFRHLSPRRDGQATMLSTYRQQIERFRHEYPAERLAGIQRQILEAPPAAGIHQRMNPELRNLARCAGGGSAAPSVTFPSISTIKADATVETARAADWTAAQTDFKERSGWIMWNSSGGAYSVPAAHRRTGTWESCPVVQPPPADSGTVYSVAWFHQHPPLPPDQVANTASFPVGPSDADKRISTRANRPGVVRDFTDTTRTTVTDYTFGPDPRPAI